MGSNQKINSELITLKLLYILLNLKKCRMVAFFRAGHILYNHQSALSYAQPLHLLKQTAPCIHSAGVLPKIFFFLRVEVFNNFFTSEVGGVGGGGEGG